MLARAGRYRDVLALGDRYGREFLPQFSPEQLDRVSTAMEFAQKVVDLALQLSGGRGMFRGNELERLYRDVRCGGFHPANAALTHEIVGKTALGVLGEEPRWG